MRQFIWWLRSCFCTHKWEREEREYDFITKDYYGNEIARHANTVVSATCTQCGWHRSYKKF